MRKSKMKQQSNEKLKSVQTGVHEEHHEEHHDHSVLKSVNNMKIVIPILLGLMVVGYLMWKQVDFDEIKKIHWHFSVFMWLGLAVFIYVLRHLVLSWRLMLFSENQFSLKKAVEIIFMWEFASAVSPTSFGGTALATYVLAQERMKSSKSITIVLYSVVVDTAFLLLAVILLFIFAGASIVGPDAVNAGEMGNYIYSFIGILAFMAAYGFFFFYGLFINPKKIKQAICYLSRIRWLSKYKETLVRTGDGVIVASHELSHKKWNYHFNVFLATAIAWTLRFGLINFIIIALIEGTGKDLYSQLVLFGRNVGIYVQTAFTPTPGASGFSEIMFSGMYSDYVPVGVALLIALVWRLISYYAYLFAGVIVVPNWIRKVMKRRKEMRNLKSLEAGPSK
jgi:glycosyltransferase 2 family protein